jgi:hypothetical protein
MSNMNYDGGWGRGIYPDPDRWRHPAILDRRPIEFKCAKCGKKLWSYERSADPNDPSVWPLCSACYDKAFDRYLKKLE